MKTIEVMSIIGGHVNEEILKRNEYLAAENEILRSKIKGRIKFNDDERRRLAKLGKDLGRKALEEIGPIVKPDTIFAWYRKLIAEKFDNSRNRKSPGRPKTIQEIEELVIKFALENESWGYDRIAGTIENLGYKISDQTIGNILKRHGISSSPGRNNGMSWSEFMDLHKDVLVGCDFFTTEVLTPVGMITYYVLFFIKIGSREVNIAGITPCPDESWMKQIARNVTMVDYGFLNGCKYVLMDRDTKFCASFRKIINTAGVKPIRLPIRSPNLNSHAERWILSVKNECLSKLILFGERSLYKALKDFKAHYHHERNHQGLDNVIPFPKKKVSTESVDSGTVQRRDRLGGILKFYYRAAS